MPSSDLQRLFGGKAIAQGFAPRVGSVFRSKKGRVEAFTSRCRALGHDAASAVRDGEERERSLLGSGCACAVHGQSRTAGRTGCT